MQLQPLTTVILDQIKEIAHAIAPRLIEIRRHIHAHPELSGQEYQTAAYVAGVLSSCGLHTQELIGKTGVVAELAGHDSSLPLLAVRTDMDALPIRELTELDFVSRQTGIMHACGHDVHTTVGLGTAMILSQLIQSEPLPGTVRFLFQPAEETAQGARWMIEDGVMLGLPAPPVLNWRFAVDEPTFLTVNATEGD